ncbi:MAG TPA: replication protein RepA, partial [Thermoanaerobaculia bacterium]|nr:replication protein RepA [Thermoanaerobaculia bacterium]
MAADDAAGRGELAFLARILVQATLPYRDPGDCTFVRKNGSYTLTLQAPPHIGLPYGRYPRLVLAYLCREAVRTRSREIRLGDSLSDFMRAVGVGVTGGRCGSLGRFREQARRLFATTLSCSWSGAVAGVAGQAEVGARIASRSVVWWGSCRAERPPEILDGGWLVLSRDF